MLELILLFSFSFVVLLVYGIYIILFGKKISIKKRMESLEQTKDMYDDSYRKEEPKVREQLDRYSEKFSKRIPSKRYLEKRKKILNQTSIPMKAEEFLVISIFAGVLFAGLLYLITSSLVFIIFGFLVGVKIPDIILGTVKRKRKKKLSVQLPEALVIIANGLRAGFGFTQAISVASQELEYPISAEFAKIVRENAMGKPVEEVLESFSKKADDEDIDMFVTALIIQRQVGGNLAEILDTLAATIREREALKGEIKTLTVEGKFSALIISLLPIVLAVAIAVINPTYISILFTNIIGIIMVVFSAFMQVTGIFFLWKIVHIDI